VHNENAARCSPQRGGGSCSVCVAESRGRSSASYAAVGLHRQRVCPLLAICSARQVRTCVFLFCVHAHVTYSLSLFSFSLCSQRTLTLLWHLQLRKYLLRSRFFLCMPICVPWRISHKHIILCVNTVCIYTRIYICTYLYMSPSTVRGLRMRLKHFHEWRFEFL
jgi:hypothetical protein